MPKKSVNFTAKNRIMILLSYKKIENSTSMLANEIGFQAGQVGRDLGDLINEELVEVKGGYLLLTEKGKQDPLIRLFNGTRQLGLFLIIYGILLILFHGFIQIIFPSGMTFATYIEIIILLGSLIMIGLIVYFYPQFILRSVKK